MATIELTYPLQHSIRARRRLPQTACKLATRSVVWLLRRRGCKTKYSDRRVARWTRETLNPFDVPERIYRDAIR